MSEAKLTTYQRSESATGTVAQAGDRIFQVPLDPEDNPYIAARFIQVGVQKTVDPAVAPGWSAFDFPYVGGTTTVTSNDNVTINATTGEVILTNDTGVGQVYSVTMVGRMDANPINPVPPGETLLFAVRVLNAGTNATYSGETGLNLYAGSMQDNVAVAVADTAKAVIQLGRNGTITLTPQWDLGLAMSASETVNLANNRVICILTLEYIGTYETS